MLQKKNQPPIPSIGIQVLTRQIHLILNAATELLENVTPKLTINRSKDDCVRL
jgi:hypothetical protein